MISAKSDAQENYHVVYSKSVGACESPIRVALYKAPKVELLKHV